MKRALILAAMAALAGCTLTRRTQGDLNYVDEDGNVLVVQCAELSRSYTYEMVSPANGAVVECKDNRVVDLILPAPSGEKVRCFICQNYGPKGTMYMSKDKKWRYWTIGTMSRLYLINETGDDYLLVFGGILDDLGGSLPAGEVL